MVYFAGTGGEIPVPLKILWHGGPLLALWRLPERGEEVQGACPYRPAARQERVSAWRLHVRKIWRGSKYGAVEERQKKGEGREIASATNTSFLRPTLVSSNGQEIAIAASPLSRINYNKTWNRL